MNETPDSPAPQTGRPATGKLAAAFVFVFAAAFLLAWLLFAPAKSAGDSAPGGAAAALSTKTLDADALAPFFAAVESYNYADMARIGGELFEEGASIPDMDALFIKYEVNSYPPYKVFAFFSNRTDDMLYRILLTMDDNRRVASFMAEDMRIIPHADAGEESGTEETPSIEEQE